jgi:hypothetical protein
LGCRTADAFGEGVQRFEPAADESHSRTGCGQVLRRRRADARPAAGDQRVTAF